MEIIFYEGKAWRTIVFSPKFHTFQFPILSLNFFNSANTFSKSINIDPVIKRKPSPFNGFLRKRQNDKQNCLAGMLFLVKNSID